MKLTEDQLAIQQAVTELCAPFDDAYWHHIEAAGEYPKEFVQALTDAGWLAALVPEEYGGAGGSIIDAAIILEALERAGCPTVVAHAQMYTMGTLLRHGSEEQKKRYLPGVADGSIRFQSFGVTEPDAGSDTTRIRTFARREGDEYIVNGSKIFTSRFNYSDVLMLLVRTQKYDDVVKKTDGMTVLLVDIPEAVASGQIEARPIETMMSHETNELSIRDLRVPVANRIGEEGKGFRYILSGMNAERVLVASEYIGHGLWFIDRATRYAREREVFGRPIGQNQGVQFPLAQAYANLHAASLARWNAAELFMAGEQPQYEANSCKLLASQALWAAANAAMDTFGGYGVTKEYGIERRFREARLPLVAPLNNNVILAGIAHGTLGLPKSY
ncbi:acyl-CoA dehydrogenase family protein [Streptomyces sp. NPDC050625]|uniref:acyl-CoA dehydrogenase family protein n=1 Tax=Streptomyces sp. NPDC050625 TaxID=3154629 RepID=UPI003426F43B